MRHAEYLTHLRGHIEDDRFSSAIVDHHKALSILVELNFDPAIPILEQLYSPAERGKNRRDPVCMLRSMILMTLVKERGVTKWVGETRKFGAFLGGLAGFPADSTPGVGTYYDFMRRIIDGPYIPPCKHVIRRSFSMTQQHKRNLKEEKEAKKEKYDPNQTQSAKLVKELLPKAGESRLENFMKIIEDLLFLMGIKPSVEAGLIGTTKDVTVSGDGSILATAASPGGTPLCDCREKGIFKCDHAHGYTSPTAEFCYDHHHDCYVFGDRYYHIILTESGHDFPIHVHMPGGNESDYTLSLTSIDRTLKMLRENGSEINIGIFIGDGHHDSYAHYDYFDKKGIIPIIPLSEKSKALPTLPDDKTVRLNENGTPLCPEGMPMRHHQYNRKRKTHVYSCPVKRETHRQGKSVYVTHADECPRKKDCMPESPLGPLVFIKSETDNRMFPPIPRDSKQFKELQKLRSGSERCNAVSDSYHIDGAHRNANYGLIRLTLACIVMHCVNRYQEKLKNVSADRMREQNLEKIRGKSASEIPFPNSRSP